MKTHLTRITPLRAGAVIGALHGILGLLLMPLVFVVFMHGASESATPAPAAFALGAVITMPPLYALFGFIGGLIAAAVYNLVAKFTGGLELEVRDVPPAA